MCLYTYMDIFHIYIYIHTHTYVKHLTGSYYLRIEDSSVLCNMQGFKTLCIYRLGK